LFGKMTRKKPNTSAEGTRIYTQYVCALPVVRIVEDNTKGGGGKREDHEPLLKGEKTSSV